MLAPSVLGAKLSLLSSPRIYFSFSSISTVSPTRPFVDPFPNYQFQRCQGIMCASEDAPISHLMWGCLWAGGFIPLVVIKGSPC